MKITQTQVLFWGAEDFMSNFYKGVGSEFTHKGITFLNSEQAFMWEKAIFFNDTVAAEKILNEKEPVKAKFLGRSVRNYNDNQWSNVRYEKMKEVLISKFNSPILKEKLLKTENKQLVEASPYDDIWGVKLGANDSRISNPNLWKGQNLLGKVLEEVRSHYQNEQV